MRHINGLMFVSFNFYTDCTSCPRDVILFRLNQSLRHDQIISPVCEERCSLCGETVITVQLPTIRSPVDSRLNGLFVSFLESDFVGFVL